MKTKQEATEAAHKLLSKLKGGGWKIKVWENLGWHCCVSNGSLNITPNSWNDEYHSLLGDGEYQNTGLPEWRNNFHHKDPNKVVEHQLKLARAYVDKLNAVVENLEKRLKK